MQTLTVTVDLVGKLCSQDGRELRLAGHLTFSTGTCRDAGSADFAVAILGDSVIDLINISYTDGGVLHGGVDMASNAAQQRHGIPAFSI